MFMMLESVVSNFNLNCAAQITFFMAENVLQR